MRNLKLVIEYDGTNYVGWQRQHNGISIQEKIENSILQVTSEKVNVVGAGRTDSGVHARGQVANFQLESSIAETELQRALNGTLPDDIVIHSVVEVEHVFSARYSAKAREYKYYISQVPVAIGRNYFWQIGYNLNIERMNAVSNSIIGIHDFQSFCKSEATVEHYLCNVEFAQWEHEANKLVFTIRANRFLHGMVRALVGTMVNVGRGYTELEHFANILNSKDRKNAGQSAPAKGLFLERVIY